MAHLRVILINRFETFLVFETEDENHRVEPMGKLKDERDDDEEEEKFASTSPAHRARSLRLGSTTNNFDSRFEFLF